MPNHVFYATQLFFLRPITDTDGNRGTRSFAYVGPAACSCCWVLYPGHRRKLFIARCDG